MYRITAIIHKDGGSPVRWEYYSKHKINKKECVEKLSRVSVAGSTYGYHVVLENYRCRKVKLKRTAKK
ncbi:DUF1187 family protein [Salmonella enterica]|uniref:DUF1187 family protein n=1 Tax=Salmonella enterica TaxID=28901 RepID=UPI0016019B7E